LNAVFTPTGTTQGVFQKSQEPITVGQKTYNAPLAQPTTSVYKTAAGLPVKFPNTYPNWGVSRIQDNTLKFKTVASAAIPGSLALSLPMAPKAMHDEMGAVYDEYGRMSAKIGIEMPLTTNLTQNFVVQAYIDPTTENVVASAPGVPTAGDGTQIWKITHNGVDTHPVHFHIFDVQLINRVGWDGSIRLPDDNELGWKDTIRISPLEDTIVAVRPVAPKLPFGIPDSILAP
jgi:FtsP/CotA-like multicopper oxidase with cupredoxin domain